MSNKGGENMSDNKIILSALTVVGMLLLGYIFNVSILLLAASVLAAVMVFLCKGETSTKMLFFFAPLSYIFTFNQYNLFIFIALAYIIKYILKGRIKISTLFVIPLIMFCIFFADARVGIKIGYLIYPILLCVIIFVCVETEQKDYSSLINIFTYGFIVSAIIGLFKVNIPSIAALFDENLLYIEGVEESMNIDRYSGISYDPNFFALIDCTLIASILFNNKKITVADGIKILFLIIVGFYTLSKSYILMLLFIGIMFLMRNGKFIIRKTVLLISLAIIVFLVEKYTQIKVITLIEARFTVADSANDLTTGRVDLWVEYLEYIANNAKTLFLGEGFNALALRKAAHNSYIDSLYRFGLIGTFLYGTYFVICYKTVVKKQPIGTKKTTIIPLIVLMAGLMFLSAFNFQQLWCCICIALFAMYASKEETHIEKP